MTTIDFELDGRRVHAQSGETLLAVAAREGVEIPHLCHCEGLEPAGNCRACMVEIEGERVLAPSCCRRPAAGMVVHSASVRARHAQSMMLELLRSDVPATMPDGSSELAQWCERLGVGASRFAPRASPAPDLSHPAFEVRLDACIHCTRCVRACRDTQVNDVLGMAFRGADSRVVFDQDDAAAASTCVACGECVQACPTGALRPVSRAHGSPVKRVDSLCPYCGVGCQVTYVVQDHRVVEVEGRDGPANHGRLCVKGRFGYDYVHHPQRLTVPLIRRADAPAKRGDYVLEPSRWQEVFREATWDEALDAAVGGLLRLLQARGPASLAGFGSAKCSNEEAYLFQKLVRTGFRNHNVDHCTRLCHASSVAALLEGIGSGAVSNPVADVAEADFVLVIGANPSVNHPVAASFLKNAVRRGTRLVLADPRATDLARHAWRHLAFRPDTDVALLNAMLHVIVADGLVDAAFVADRTRGFDDLVRRVAAFTPEAMAPVCGIAAATIREVAHAYATSRASMILWGMGVSQHVHGTDNARCLIALALATGQIGRPGTGLHPLRGQNNVQGASDAGLIPMMYPDYRRVDDAQARADFERRWGVTLEERPGLTVVEIMDAARRGEIRGLYVMGENQAMSDPDVTHAREALAALEHLVVQDLFLTETAVFADVVLPAAAFAEKTGTFTNTDRLVQMARQALEPPGQARADWWITQAIAQRLGLPWSYAGPAEIFDEMRHAMPSIAGITWERLEREHAVTYPCMQEGDAGQRVLFAETFPMPDGRAHFVPADLVAAAEQPDDDYPFVLITGRQLEHWHTGSMTRRSTVLDAIEPDPVALAHPDDLVRLGIDAGGLLTLRSRRGSVSLYARADTALPRGAVFVAFCWFEAAVNRLTRPQLDPVAKIPGFKYCAVRVEPGGTAPARTGYGPRAAPALIS
jgi:formate dehydrogenase major subunit